MVGIELILGILALILAIVGVAQIKLMGGKGPSKVNAAGVADQAAYQLGQIEYFAKTGNKQLAVKSMYNLMKQIETGRDERGRALKYDNFVEDRIRKDIKKIQEKYREVFNEVELKPRMTIYNKLKAQDRTIYEVDRRARLVGPSWYAAFKGLIPVDQAQQETNDVISTSQKLYQQEQRAAERSRMAKMA